MTLAQVLAGPHLRTETEGVFVIEPLEFIRVEEEPSYIVCATCGRSICAHSDLEYAGLAGREG